MTQEERKILLDKVNKFYDDHFLSGEDDKECCLFLLSLISEDDISGDEIYVEKSLYDLMSDEVSAKKFLINNNFGVFGSLFYKYKDSFDIELVKTMIERDLITIHSCYPMSVDSNNNLTFLCNHPSFELVKNDKDYLVDNCFPFINYLKFFYDNEILYDEKFIRKYLNRWGLFNFKKIPSKIRNDELFLINLIKVEPKYFDRLSDEYKNNKYFVVKLLDEKIELKVDSSMYDVIVSENGDKYSEYLLSDDNLGD